MAALSLKPSSKSVAVLIILATIILFGCVLGYVAAAGKLKAINAELERKDKEVRESKQIAQKLEKSKLDYLDARSQVRYLETSVATQDYIPTLLKQLERLGKSVNLKVVSVRPDPTPAAPAERSISSGAKASEGNVEGASELKSANGKNTVTKVSPYDELKISVEADGRYMSALDFLYKLTSFPKIIAVNAVELTPADKSICMGSPSLRIKLSLTAYVLKEQAPPKEDSSDTSSNSKGSVKNEAG